VINLPLGEAAALRVAAKGIFQDKGFWFNRRINRDIGRRDVLLGRVQLLVKPSDAVDMVFKFEGQRGRSELGSPEFFGRNQTVPPTPGITCPGDPRCLNVLGYRDPDTDPFRGDWSVRPDFDVDQISLSAKIDVDLGFATLTSVTGYIDFDRQWGVDVDASPARITDFYTDDRVEQFSQELRIAGETDSFNWLVGGFYSRDKVFTSYDGDLQDLFRTTTFSSSDQLTKSAAIFANGEWKLGDTVDLITGVRYTHEKRSNIGGTSDLVSVPPGSFLTRAPFGSPPIRLSFVDQTIRDNNFSWKVGLNWKPSSATLIYASASQGVKSGGFFAGVWNARLSVTRYLGQCLVDHKRYNGDLFRNSRRTGIAQLRRPGCPVLARVWLARQGRS
jgi:iron complex outermembrane receptor protein